MAVTRLAVLLDRQNEPDWIIAGICEMHPSLLSRYKSGNRSLPQKHAVKLAEHFGVSLDDVRGEATDEWRTTAGV